MNIKDLIFSIRGKQVMLDSDIAMLYDYETKVINRTAKRNQKRFPEEFCFRLTEEEYKSLRCQNSTLNEESDIRSQNVTASKDVDEESLRLQTKFMKM